jgi:hypothetical protein
MAYTANNAFITMFGDEVHHSFQQLESKLQGSVRTVRGVVGSTYKFPVLGKSGVIKNKTATADLEHMSGISNTAAVTTSWYGEANVTMPHSNVSATINTYATGEYIDDFDALKTNIDLRNAYAESIAGAMNRAVDGEIISALDAIANTSLATGTAAIDCTSTATFDKTAILEAKRRLDVESVPQSDRFLVLSPQAVNDLMSNSQIVSSDFGVISNQALTTGNIGSLFGFNIIMSNELTTTLTPNSGVACYAFHKNAIGCAVGKEITTLVNYVPQKLSTLIAAEHSTGAVAVDPVGVVRIAVV